MTIPGDASILCDESSVLGPAIKETSTFVKEPRHSPGSSYEGSSCPIRRDLFLSSLEEKKILQVKVAETFPGNVVLALFTASCGHMPHLQTSKP